MPTFLFVPLLESLLPGTRLPLLPPHALPRLAPGARRTRLLLTARNGRGRGGNRGRGRPKHAADAPAVVEKEAAPEMRSGKRLGGRMPRPERTELVARAHAFLKVVREGCHTLPGW